MACNLDEVTLLMPNLAMQSPTTTFVPVVSYRDYLKKVAGYSDEEVEEILAYPNLGEVVEDG